MAVVLIATTLMVLNKIFLPHIHKYHWITFSVTSLTFLLQAAFIITRNTSLVCTKISSKTWIALNAQYLSGLEEEPWTYTGTRADVLMSWELILSYSEASTARKTGTGGGGHQPRVHIWHRVEVFVQSPLSLPHRDKIACLPNFSQRRDQWLFNLESI